MDGLGFTPTQQGQPGGRDVAPQGRQMLNVRLDQNAISGKRQAVPTDLVYPTARFAEPEVHTAFGGELVVMKNDSPATMDGLPLVLTSLNGEQYGGRSFASVVSDYAFVGVSAMPGTRHNDSGHIQGSASFAVAVRALTTLTNRSGTAWTPGPLMWDFPTAVEAEMQLQSGGQIVPVLRSYSKFAHGCSTRALAAEIARPTAARRRDSEQAISGASLRLQSALATFAVTTLGMWMRAGVVRYEAALFEYGPVGEGHRADASTAWRDATSDTREHALTRVARAARIDGVHGFTDADVISVHGAGVDVSNYMRMMLLNNPQARAVAPSPGSDAPPPDARGPLMTADMNMLNQLVASIMVANDCMRDRIVGKSMAAVPKNARGPVMITG